MKRFIILFVIFICALISIISLPNFLATKPIDMQTITPNIIDYNLNATATGTIKESDNINITIEFDIVIKEFLKKVGDTVEEGDVLFKIDKQETLKLLSNTYSDAEISLYKDYINTFPLEYISEYNGIVTQINEEKIIYANNNIMQLSTGSGYVANVYISEKDISNICIGQTASISGVAFGDKVYTGKVAKISKDATEQTINNKKETVVKAQINISNPDDKLKSGYNIKAQITNGKIKNAITIPYEALREDEDSYYVYKLFNDNYVYKSNVKVVFEDDDYVIINGNIDSKTKLGITNNAIEDKIVRVNVINKDIKY